MAIARNGQKNIYIYASMGIFLVGSIAGAAYAGYYWYRNAQETAAYKALSESLEGYAKAAATASSSGKESPNQWAEVQQALTIGAELHSSSSLYPYFLAYQSNILERQGKEKEALDLMDKALAHIDKNSPLYYAYALKDALMNVDSPDASKIQKGRALVEKLAHDTVNPLQNMARYYSALDARSRGEMDVAQRRLQEIIATGDEGSVWYQKASSSLHSMR